ncbi:MAG: hypothetical protein R3Y56_09405 [Akkermansia sp.]
MRILLLCCTLLFIAAVAGAVYCGEQLNERGLDVARELYLRRLIYFHFVLSQLSMLGAVLVVYLGRFRAQRQHLVICYNEKGLGILPPGIRLRPHTTYQSCLGQMRQAKLPSPRHPIVVYPMFMQSGFSSGERLLAELKSAYAAKGGQEPQLFVQPVLGASPWLAEQVAKQLTQALAGMTEPIALLVVAHGAAAGQQPAPEPELFCRRLAKLLPHREIKLSTIGTADDILEDMSQLAAPRVLLLPFLMTEGMHFTRDLPTKEQAQHIGKELHIQAVVGDLLSRV